MLDQLPALVTAEIPQLMFDRAAQEEFDEFNYRLQAQGIDFDTYLNYTGMERDAMMAMYREQAETNVKTRLALEKIVELEQIEPAEDEIEAEYAKLAENYKMDIDKIKAVEEMKQQLRIVLAQGRCKAISREEVHELVDEIFDEYA